MRTPSLGTYDGRRGKAELHQPDQVMPDFKAALGFEKDYPSTRDADYALLVRLGVNGEVPLAQAMANAGLLASGGIVGRDGKASAWFASRPANDNHEQAAVAA